nr:aldo/keto reductase [uncultured Carboxylicivirga sp.]
MKKLGNTGLICPPIVYGTSYLGNLYQELTEEEKLALIKEWFNVSYGNVTIDSAGKYGAGLALEVIAHGLKKLGFSPKDITISIKLGWYRVPLESSEPTFEPGAWVNLQYDAVQKISYSGILECWEQGCRLLDGFKPLLVSVHDPDEYLQSAHNEEDRLLRMDNILGAYKALFELKEKGEVKAVGIGSKDWLVIKELYDKVHFDWVMFANKFTLYHHPAEILHFFEQLHKDGVVIINSAIFNGGFLTGGQYFDYRKVEESDLNNLHLFEWRKRFFKVCKYFFVDPGDACLKFALSAPQVNAVALNPSKPHRMLHNKHVVDSEFTGEFWNALKAEAIISNYYPYV